MVAIPSLAGGISYFLLLLTVQVAAAPAAENVKVTPRGTPDNAAADGLVPAVLNPRATKAGGVNMETLCHEQWGQGWAPLLYGNSANDWKCWYYLINYAGPINVDAYCKKHYGGNANASAPGGGKYDWGCYYP
jgi:hypothetical protein